MKKILLFYYVLFLSVSSVVYADDTAIYTDRILAVVNDDIILQSEVEDILPRLPDYRENLPERELYILKKKVIDNLIGDYLLIDIAKKNKIEVSDDELDEALDEQIARIKSRFPDDEAFRNALRRSYTSMKDLKEKYRLQITKKIFKDKYMAKVLSAEVNVTEKDVEDLYQSSAVQVRVKHILVNTREKAKDLLKKLKNGETFEDLARAYSMDASGKNGGDLGDFVKRTDLVKPFADAAFQLKKGEVSDVVHTQFGYHIIKLIDRREKKLEKLTPKKSNYYKNFLFSQKMEELLEKQIEKERNESYIDIRLSPAG